MEKIIDIEDKFLGLLNGRDCIYIDKVTFTDGSALEFEGELNGCLCSEVREEKWIPYKLTFKSVISHFVCELDTYEGFGNTECYGHSDFTEIENSDMLEKIPIRSDYSKFEYKHFRVFTYDYVFDIIAQDFELLADLENAELMRGKNQ